MFRALLFTLATLIALPATAQELLDGYPLYKDRRSMIRSVTDLAKAGDYAGLIASLNGTRPLEGADLDARAKTLTRDYGPALSHHDILYHKELAGNWIEEVLALWNDGKTHYFYITIISHNRSEGTVPVFWRAGDDVEEVLPHF